MCVIEKEYHRLRELASQSALISGKIVWMVWIHPGQNNARYIIAQTMDKLYKNK
jgi:hypothetical protein